MMTNVTEELNEEHEDTNYETVDKVIKLIKDSGYDEVLRRLEKE